MNEHSSADGPLEVLELRRRLVVARDMEAFAGLFAAEGVIEMPFAANGLPARLEGREAIREFSARPAAFRWKLPTCALSRSTRPWIPRL